MIKGRFMNKGQLVDALSSAEDLSKSKAASVVDAFLDVLTKTMATGEQVAIAGFGIFTVKKRPARVGRNPRTGGDLQIPEAMVVGFKAGKALKDAVNEKKKEAA
ncbi:MAG TPA: HU family DNA-binding protein [Gammaproteobacteria bacterium]|nr:HU family DNA-binding protein [Gammaproteobacteria bacterium]HRA43288.1 HU family DNA-binding protein [Gammaproteobacteria bacterium]